MGAVESREPPLLHAVSRGSTTGQSRECGRGHRQQQHEQSRRHHHQCSPAHPSLGSTRNDEAAPPSYDEAMLHFAPTDPLLDSDWSHADDPGEAAAAARQPYPPYTPCSAQSGVSAAVANDIGNGHRSGSKADNRATSTLLRQEWQRYATDGPTASTSSTPVLPVTTTSAPASTVLGSTRSPPNAQMHSQPYTSPLAPTVGYPSYGSLAPSLSSETAHGGGRPPYQIIHVHHYGLCAAGGDHALETEFTLPGILCALGCFPCGVACCLCMTERRCVKCGARFD
ncbi:hypothetical protein H4R35_004163 [Dimargaris xerosporica]|nr:hypothetical protein H4R35_004163 [Dimargaris xerosporica]